MKFLLTLLILISFASCGYKPSSKLSREVMGEKISTSIIISAQDPENTVIIKDAVDEAVIKVFHASLRKKSNSDTHLDLSIASPSYTPIVYDTDGFVIGYRMSVSLSIIRYHSGLNKKYTASGTYDFSVEKNAVVTDQQRFDAIRFSAAKAIRSFVAQVSAEGARAKK
ncbi:LPS assembly lipoprotein LptE [Sulfurimonas sp.]|uniref:LPS assembly lipoprotein LptE n=1 Tax=Sulfurimonas sp. TaxID=2022749 RepID=UPI002AAFABDF|nr:LPS assembly lipoprotein LptE [Sulfurimonas sp.]